jgi:hypothetical protein
MWNILCEMKLRGSMTKVQFEKCVKYVLQDETGKDDDMVRLSSVYLFAVLPHLRVGIILGDVTIVR